MVQIDLTIQQAEELKAHYILELERLQQRSATIMGILEKLVLEPVLPLPAKQVSLPQPEEKTKSKTKKEVETKPIASPTSRVRWTDFILQLLKESDKPLTADQILQEYQKQNNVNLTGSKTAFFSLNQALFRLRSKQNRITSSRRKGEKGNVYALVKQADAAVTNAQPELVEEEVSVLPVQADVAEVTAQPEVVEKLEKKEKELPAHIKLAWPQFFLDTLTKQRRILSVKDFVKHAMVHFEIPAHDKKSTGKMVSAVLSYMVRTLKQIKPTRKAHQSASYYGLIEWFSDKNELISVYK